MGWPSGAPVDEESCDFSAGPWERVGISITPPNSLNSGAQKLPAHAGHPLLSAAVNYQLGMAAARIFAPVNISLRHKTTCEPSSGGMLYLTLVRGPKSRTGN